MRALQNGAKVSAPRISLHPLRPSLLLQRKCDCGQHTGGGECEECKKKKSADALLQRSAMNAGAVNNVPPIVHEVLRSPGRPLDMGTRAYFEPRFGQDFSRVRVHTDASAAESASAVGALAYAYGPNVVFAKDQFSSGSLTGRRLLAHELAHVVQTGDTNSKGEPQRVSFPGETSEVEAETMSSRVMAATLSPADSKNPQQPANSPSGTVFRLVAPSRTHCVGGNNGAPADPSGTLTSVEAHAQGLAEGAAILFAVAPAGLSLGISGGSLIQVYQNRFGLPPKRGAGFLNRLSGRVEKTQNEAMAAELDGISDRFDKMDKNFDRKLTYRCIHGPVSLDGCDTDCVKADASACQGVPTFFICPSFWGLSPTAMATLLIHESFHMLFGQTGHGGTGVGRNLRHAECYASAVSDIFNFPTRGGPACPSPPQ